MRTPVCDKAHCRQKERPTHPPYEILFPFLSIPDMNQEVSYGGSRPAAQWAHSFVTYW